MAGLERGTALVRQGPPEGDRSRQGRWLVGQEPEAQPRVLATAEFDTEGYKASDWDVADGQKAPTGLAGCLAGT